MTTQNSATYCITLFLSLITICIITVDRPLALLINDHLTGLHKPLSRILSSIEFISGFTISKYLVAMLIILGGTILLLKDKSLQRAGIFFFIGGTLAISRLTAGILKMIFERTRPYDFVKDISTRDFFAGEGSSFPSAHAAHFFGLFLPLIVLFPRYKALLLVIPAFVALQRVLVNDHYVSDVLAGAMIAALFTLLFQRLFKIQDPSLFLPPKKPI